MRAFVACCFILSAMFNHTAAEQRTVVYPRPESQQDNRADYPLRLLTLALGKSEEDWVLSPSRDVMVQSRAIQQLALDTDVDVLWSMTSRAREEKLAPIRIPISKGLIGWRLFLHIPDNGVRLSKDISLQELQDHILIQGHDWPDTRVLRHAGFQVMGAANYDNTFYMLAHRRADLFPRSLSEIWAEYESFKHMGFQVEPHVLLQYPTAMYFFVNKEDRELRSLIKTGLNKAIDDGSFDRLFWQFHRTTIEQARLKQRKVFRLSNPLLPEATPLEDTRLWYRIR